MNVQIMTAAIKNFPSENNDLALRILDAEMAALHTLDKKVELEFIIWEEFKKENNLITTEKTLDEYLVQDCEDVAQWDELQEKHCRKIKPEWIRSGYAIKEIGYCPALDARNVENDLHHEAIQITVKNMGLPQGAAFGGNLKTILDMFKLLTNSAPYDAKLKKLVELQKKIAANIESRRVWLESKN